MHQKFQNVSKPDEPLKTYRCPCCQFKTLHGRGNYEICRVCFWEDDGQDDHDSDEVRGGPNGSFSLTQARENYARHNVYDLKFLSKVRAPLEDEK